MQMFVPSSLRVRVALAVAVVAATLGFTPVTMSSADAASKSVAGSVSSECSTARAVLAQVRRQQAVAKYRLVNARTALRKAKKTEHPVKIRKATKAVAAAQKRYRTVTRVVHDRAGRAAYACSAPTSAVRAEAAGRSLALLAVANGLDLGPISADELTTLLADLVPGIAEELTAGQLAALLTGFNTIAAGGASAASLLTVLAGAFTLADVAALLGGSAGGDLIADLVDHVAGLLGGLSGLPVPGEFGLDGLLDAFTGLLPGLCEIVALPLLCE